MTDIKPSDCRCTAFFCEENVWLLARDLVDEGTPADHLEVLFFINSHDSVLMQAQRAATGDTALVWDYHVVLRRHAAQRDQILDLDTRLGFPCATPTYLAASFPAQYRLPVQLRTWVRIVPAAAYLANFHSDRSHMIGQLPESEFPPYPYITPPPGNRRIDLAAYRDPRRELGDGSRVCPLDALLADGSRPATAQSTR